MGRFALLLLIFQVFIATAAESQNDLYVSSLKNIWSKNAGQTFSFNMEGIFEVKITFPKNPDLNAALHVTLNQLKGDSLNFEQELLPSGYEIHDPADPQGGILYFIKIKDKSFFRAGIAADGSVLLAAFVGYGTTRVPIFGKGMVSGATLSSIMKSNEKPADVCAAMFFPEVFYPEYFRHRLPQGISR